MTTKTEFDAIAADWPNTDASSFIFAGSLLWHVQRFDHADEHAPMMLLLHGTGASTHSWGPIIPELSKQFHVVAVDLPGHGFSERPSTAQLSLEGMSRLLERLCETLKISPDFVVGHSAGAAIAAHMTLGQMIAPKGLVSIAGAFMPIGGSNNGLFSLLAKLMAGNPFSARIFAWRSRNPAIVKELMDRTGSKLTAETYDQYAVLARNRRHVSAALGMMAHWNLRGLNKALSSLTTPLLVLTGEADTMIPASDGPEVAKLVPNAELINMKNVGHLLHEEAPVDVAARIFEFTEKCTASKS